MPFKELTQDNELASELRNSQQAQLVVVDFYATWCGPCIAIAPFYHQLSVQYPDVLFLKCDVDKCSDTARECNVSAMPTFVFFKGNVELERIRGADKVQLENKVKQYSATSSANSEKNTGSSDDSMQQPQQQSTPGFIDLCHLINKPQCECLNECDDHTWTNVLNNSHLNYLKSDCDEQLILYISFNQTVKLNSLVVQAPADNGPKKMKLFINQTRTLDFDTAERSEPVQEFDLQADDLKNNQIINLRYVKFQNVQNLTMFFANNQSGSDSTVINYIKFIGTPVVVTNMNEFKRVSGHAGESHG